MPKPGCRKVRASHSNTSRLTALGIRARSSGADPRLTPWPLQGHRVTLSPPQSAPAPPPAVIITAVSHPTSPNGPTFAISAQEEGHVISLFFRDGRVNP